MHTHIGHMHIQMCTYIHIHKHIDTYTPICTQMYTYTIYTCRHSYNSHTYMHNMSTDTYTYTFVDTEHIYTHMNAHTMYIHMHYTYNAHTHVHIHTPCLDAHTGLTSKSLWIMTVRGKRQQRVGVREANRLRARAQPWLPSGFLIL